MMAPDQIVALFVGVNALGLALLLVGLRLSGRQINAAVLWLLIAIVLLMALNLEFGRAGENTPLTRIRWGLSLVFGPLLAWYVRVDAGGEGLRQRDLWLHGTAPVVLIIAFAVGMVTADVAAWIVAVQISVYLALIASMSGEGAAGLRKRVLVAIGGGLLLINLVQLALRLFAPALDDAFRAVLLLGVAVLIGLFVLFGIADPGALFRRVAETVVTPGQSRLSDIDIAEINRRIDALFEAEEPWLDPEFGLDALAGRVDALPREVSLAVNSVRGIGVPELINIQRVRAVQRRLGDTARGMSLLEIALECGFRSKATFNRAFRRHADTTPREARHRASTI